MTLGYQCSALTHRAIDDYIYLQALMTVTLITMNFATGQMTNGGVVGVLSGC